MDKLTLWLVTVIGVLLVLPLLGVSALDAYSDWIVALAVLVIGVLGLVKVYK